MTNNAWADSGRRNTNANQQSNSENRLNPFELAAIARIEDLRKRLLDLTTSNYLLSFKFTDRGRNHVRLVDEWPDHVTLRLTEGKRLTFRSLPELPDEPLDEKTNEFILALDQVKRVDHHYREMLRRVEDEEATEDDLRKAERILKDRMRQQLGMKPRKEAMMIPKAQWARSNGIDPSFDLTPRFNASPQSRSDSEIQTLQFPEEMERTLSGIHSQARTNLQEKGIETLYVAIGFLEWYESRDSDKPLYAPLLLHPVDIERKLRGSEYRYSVGSLGEEAEVNATLGERLARDFNIRLPALEANEAAESYLKRIEQIVADQPRWKVRRFMVVGHLAFARLVMFRDLAQDSWPGGMGVAESAIIVHLFGGGDNGGGSDFADQYEVDRPDISAKVPLLITDADSSQFSAIVDVMDGKNLVLKGPPGTGKSQTIQNIIAAALMKGQSVLFVAEKMAALNVVKQRLEKCGLGDFCLELHSTKARKRELLDSLEARITAPRITARKKELEEAIHEHHRLKNELGRYVETINKPYGSMGKTIHQIFWAEQRTRDRQNRLPESLDRYELRDSSRLTKPELDVMKARIATAARIHGDIVLEHGGLKSHPWYGVGDANLNYFSQEALLRAGNRLKKALFGMAESIANVSAVVSYAIPQTYDGASSTAKLLKRIPTPSDDCDIEIFAQLNGGDTHEAMKQFVQDLDSWSRAFQKLSAAAHEPTALSALRADLEALMIAVKRAKVWRASVGDLPALHAEQTKQMVTLARGGDHGRRILDAFGLNEVSVTPSALFGLVEAIKVAERYPRELLSLRHPGLLDEDATRLLESAAEVAKAIREDLMTLSERFSLSLEANPAHCREHARSLRAAGFLGFLSSSVRAATRAYREILRAPQKTKRHQMASDLDQIAICIERVRTIAQDQRLSQICGPHFNSHETNFDDLARISRFSAEVRRINVGSEALGRAVRDMLLEGKLDKVHSILGLAETEEHAVMLGALAICSERPEQELKDAQAELSARAEAVLAASAAANAMKLLPSFDLSGLDAIIEAADKLRMAEDRINSDSVARTILGSRFAGSKTPKKGIVAALEFSDSINHATLPHYFRDFLFSIEVRERISELSDLRARIAQAVAELDAAWEEFRSVGRIDEHSYFNGSLTEANLGSALGKLDTGLSNRGYLSQLLEYAQLKAECDEIRIGGILDLIDEADISEKYATTALEHVVNRNLAKSAVDEHPILSRFRGVTQDRARADFQRLDEQIIRLQQGLLAASLCERPVDAGQRTASVKEYTGLVLLNHEASKQRNHVPIRDLLDRAGTAIKQLKPCFMMSPLSVAQFLKPGKLSFDLVVIDEASQMRPEEALGAIARGGQLVVVGDPMQLPPTSFFNRSDNSTGDDDEDQEELVHSESILDSALAAFRPARDLRWHYRSRHESLIAFSNREFYDNRLVVFPSPLDPDRERREPRLGVYHHFVDGTYKGSINTIESLAVAKAAIQFMRDYPDKSLGIVTLNQSQCEILQGEIDRLRAHDREVAHYIEHWDSNLEQFFVKNLENVQGDERDVIFISTVYGPDPQTKVVMNRFGPINSPVGHRRLNVLFTRAKERIEIFTSLRPNDITADLNWGPKALRAYLEYAETGKLQGGISTGRGADSDFEEFVRDALRQNGFDAVPQVGVAGYFIDLAVKHPQRSGFILGIECDGATYHSSKSARDRDRLRQLVLERLNWKIYRIWSTDWFNNPDQETRKLIEHIKHLVITGT